jgi:hypothetical protein
MLPGNFPIPFVILYIQTKFQLIWDSLSLATSGLKFMSSEIWNPKDGKEPQVLRKGTDAWLIGKTYF